MKKSELAWIGGFMKKVKAHIFVREEDSVLILPPNKVYKLNATGIALLKATISGLRIDKAEYIRDGEEALDVHMFFCDLAALYRGCPELPGERKAIESVPFGLGFTTLPILGEIALTYRCNNNCAFCYAACKPGRACKELQTNDIKRIIDAFRDKAKIPFFSFTGGEPLLRDDLEELIAYAIRKRLSVNLITNGTLATCKRAKSLAASGLSTAQVSIESPNPLIHDALTRSQGSFARTIEGIKNLRKRGISVQTNTTLNAMNRESLSDLPGFLSSLGISKFSMNLFIPCGTGLENTNLFVSYSETGAVIETIRKKAEENGLVFYWYSPTPHCYYNPIAKGLGNKSCAAMDGLLSVAPDGTVLPCSSYPESMGNILKDEFTEIWFSKRASFFKNKQYAPKDCEGCEEFTACQSACPLYWAYAGTSELRRGKAIQKSNHKADFLSAGNGGAAYS